MCSILEVHFLLQFQRNHCKAEEENKTDEGWVTLVAIVAAIFCNKNGTLKRASTSSEVLNGQLCCCVYWKRPEQILQPDLELDMDLSTPSRTSAPITYP